MKNRVTVTIAGQEYTLVGSEDAGYTKKVAEINMPPNTRQQVMKGIEFDDVCKNLH